MDYVIIKAGYLIDLMEIVKDFMQHGFIPCGGVTTDKYRVEYLQAMYKPMPIGYATSIPSVSPPYVITEKTQ